MGLTNSPSSFQNLMNNIFQEYLINDSVLLYLDDTLIFSRSPEEHIRHLELVLRKLEEYKLSAHLKKCQFAGKTHMDFLGHVPLWQMASEWTWTQRSRGCERMAQAQGCLAFTLISRTCKLLSTMELHHSCGSSDHTVKERKYVKDDWRPTCDAVFAEVKRMLTSAPVLQAPNRLWFTLMHPLKDRLGAALLQGSMLPFILAN
jgi:hypothetical protein